MAALAALCLVAGSLQVSLPVTQFGLRWQHSIEKIEWTEDYEVAGPWLHLSQARIRGSGAGMEPPEGATLVDGVCRRLTHWLPISAGPTTLRACDAR